MGSQRVKRTNIFTNLHEQNPSFLTVISTRPKFKTHFLDSIENCVSERSALPKAAYLKALLYIFINHKIKRHHFDSKSIKDNLLVRFGHIPFPFSPQSQKFTFDSNSGFWQLERTSFLRSMLLKTS